MPFGGNAGSIILPPLNCAGYRQRTVTSQEPQDCAQEEQRAKARGSKAEDSEGVTSPVFQVHMDKMLTALKISICLF